MGRLRRHSSSLFLTFVSSSNVRLLLRFTPHLLAVSPSQWNHHQRNPRRPALSLITMRGMPTSTLSSPRTGIPSRSPISQRRRYHTLFPPRVDSQTHTLFHSGRRENRVVAWRVSGGFDCCISRTAVRLGRKDYAERRQAKKWNSKETPRVLAGQRTQEAILHRVCGEHGIRCHEGWELERSHTEPSGSERCMSLKFSSCLE